jgi:glutaredoxin-related protein
MNTFKNTWNRGRRITGQRHRKYFQLNYRKYFPNLRKYMLIKAQEEELDQKRSAQNIIIKTIHIQNKERILKTAKETMK